MKELVDRLQTAVNMLTGIERMELSGKDALLFGQAITMIVQVGNEMIGSAEEKDVSLNGEVRADA